MELRKQKERIEELIETISSLKRQIKNLTAEKEVLMEKQREYQRKLNFLEVKCKSQEKELQDLQRALKEASEITSAQEDNFNAFQSKLADMQTHWQGTGKV